MDLSAHTDTHQQQQQQQQQQHQAYDPSQVQAYYTYPHQYDQQQQYPYYPPDYTNIYQQHHHHEPTSIHPPGVPIPPETTTHLVAPEYGQTHLQDQQNAYYPQGVVEQQHQQLSNSDSAAAVAFPQWQGNGAGFGAMPVHDGSGSIPQPIGQSSYRGGGRRGGRPFRGGGRNRGGFRSDGSGPPFRGRGRGRGGGRFAPSEGAAAAPAHAAPHWPPPRMAWCELCRVDCTTLEILEQHKNGKRHKKNLQVFEELQNLNKLITGMQNQQMPTSEFKPEGVIQPEKVEGFEEKQPPPKNLPSEAAAAAAAADRNETEPQKDLAEKSETAELTEEPERKLRTDHFEARGRGFKRTMRGGRGGKRIRTTEGPRRPIEPPRPKQVIPFICELCNVKCDSQVVFDSHLAGKKHISNFTRYQGYQAILGAVVLQALCQPNPNAPSTSFIPQLHQQGIHDPLGFFSQPVPYMLPQSQALAGAPVPVMESQDQQDFKLQGSQTILKAGNQNPVAVEAKIQLKSIEEEVKSPSAMNNDTKAENEMSLCLDSSVMAPLETIVEGTEQVLSETATDKAVVIPKDEVASSDQGVPPGLDCKMEEPKIKE